MFAMTIVRKMLKSKKLHLRHQDALAHEQHGACCTRCFVMPNTRTTSCNRSLERALLDAAHAARQCFRAECLTRRVSFAILKMIDTWCERLVLYAKTLKTDVPETLARFAVGGIFSFLRLEFDGQTSGE
jgi:hypothetical protein